jgi:hypothetical protein
MKKILCLIFILCFGVVAWGEFDAIKLELTNIKTNTTPNAPCQFTNSQQIVGVIEALILDVQGYACPTCDIDVMTVPAFGTGNSRIIYSANSVGTTNLILPIRLPSKNTSGTTTGGTNAMNRIPLIGDKIILKAYKANTNNIIDVRGYLLIER